jgi:hypothetical protein
MGNEVRIEREICGRIVKQIETDVTERNASQITSKNNGAIDR